MFFLLLKIVSGYSPRIIGGEVAKIQDFNWQAALLYNSQHFCGGSIVEPTKILTAAHCVYKITNIAKLQVRVGSIASDKGGILKNVAKIVTHPDFNKPTSLNNDIAVLVLTEALVFQPTVNGIALAPKSLVLQPGTGVTASGYGSTSINSQKPDVLHFVAMPVVSQSDCLKAYSKYTGKAKVTEKMICAGFYGTGGKDACQGDSGGLNFDIEHIFENSFTLFLFQLFIFRTTYL